MISTKRTPTAYLLAIVAGALIGTPIGLAIHAWVLS